MSERASHVMAQVDSERWALMTAAEQSRLNLEQQGQGEQTSLAQLQCCSTFAIPGSELTAFTEVEQMPSGWSQHVQSVVIDRTDTSAPHHYNFTFTARSLGHHRTRIQQITYLHSTPHTHTTTQHARPPSRYCCRWLVAIDYLPWFMAV